MITTASRSTAPTQARVLAMWRAQAGALMLLGRAPGPIPRAGSARAAATSGAFGVFRAEFWPLSAEPGYAFIAAVRLPDRADPADDGELALRGSRGADVDFRLQLVPALAEVEFGRQVASAAGTHAGRLARFMLDVTRSDEGSDMRRPNAVLLAFLNGAARLDGCVELMLHVPEKGVVLQGWGTPPPQEVDVLLGSPGLPRFSAQSGDFPRNDVSMPATGNVLLLPVEAVSALPKLEKLFLVAGEELLCRTVVEPRVLDSQTSIGQIRHLLPRLSCPASMRAVLRTILQPRYEGQDTVSTSSRPVRAALDLAVTASGAGSYLSGWLFDPAGEVAEVHLCGDGRSARLDADWTRVARHDVSVAFSANPAFPRPPGHEHGFTVATDVAFSPDEAAYLQVTFPNGDAAFLPVRFGDLRATSAVQSLLNSVDLYKPSGLRIVEQHLAPLMARLEPVPSSPGRLVVRGPLDRAYAIVVPLRRATLPRAFISSFLADPPGEDEQIVFVCGPEWDHAGRDALRALVEFYALPASIVDVPRTPRAAEAVEQAASLTAAQFFLLTAPALVGSSGWRAALYEGPRSDAACPTVLYEDRSIRFAGSADILFTAAPPYARWRTPFAGLPASLAPSGAAVAVKGGTLACCLLRRTALKVLERSRRFHTDAGQEAAFFASLADAGLRGCWVPSVQVSAPEEDEAESVGVGPMVDGWVLRAASEERVRCAS